MSIVAHRLSECFLCWQTYRLNTANILSCKTSTSWGFLRPVRSEISNDGYNLDVMTGRPLAGNKSVHLLASTIGRQAGPPLSDLGSSWWCWEQIQIWVPSTWQNCSDLQIPVDVCRIYSRLIVSVTRLSYHSDSLLVDTWSPCNRIWVTKTCHQCPAVAINQVICYYDLLTYYIINFTLQLPDGSN